MHVAPSAPSAGSYPPGPLDAGLLVGAAAALGQVLTPGQVDQFERYAAEITAWNRQLNLTRLVSPSQIALGHFADSLACLLALPDRAPPGSVLSCVDVGSGAGLPGLALAIVRPAWRLALVEATGKKAVFLEHVVVALALDSVLVLPRRAEEVGRMPDQRERSDLVVSRAVARLAVLLEYAMPLLRVGGLMVALKGADGPAEARSCTAASQALGGEPPVVMDYRVPGLAGERFAVSVRKVGETPSRFPRRPGVPSKKPL